MEEIWKDIRDYENMYQISNLGRVKSLNYNNTGREKIMKPSVDKDGYLFVRLCKNGKVKNFKVHRLVAQAFISNTNNYPQGNHKDENPSNNFVNNLEWCDAKYNSNYGTRTKRVAGKLAKKVLQIDKNTNEIISEFQSIMEVQRQLEISISHISEWCNNKPHHNTAYGYKWKYKEESVTF